MIIIIFTLMSIHSSSYLGFDKTMKHGHDGKIVSGETAERLEIYLSRLVPFGFSGALLVEKDEKIV